MGTYLILGAGLVHFLSIGVLGRIPRIGGGALVASYGYFLYAGLIQ
jgi:cation:H+ antiporter